MSQKHGSPLSSGEAVYRMLKLNSGNKAEATDFDLSSQENADVPPLLSVWAESVVTPITMRSERGDSSRFSHYASLNVDDIRGVCRSETDLSNYCLDVVWDIIGFRDGHAGISGLMRPPNIERCIFKKLRVKLADLANKNIMSFDE